jgi:hypothetical protein
MQTIHIESVGAEPGRQKRDRGLISKVVAATLKRWQSLRNDPLLFMLLVWAFLFLIAGLINVQAQSDHLIASAQAISPR